MSRRRFASPQDCAETMAEFFGAAPESAGEALVAVIIIRFGRRPRGPRKIIVTEQPPAVVGSLLDKTG